MMASRPRSRITRAVTATSGAAAIAWTATKARTPGVRMSARRMRPLHGASMFPAAVSVPNRPLTRTGRSGAERSLGADPERNDHQLGQECEVVVLPPMAVVLMMLWQLWRGSQWRGRDRSPETTLVQPLLAMVVRAALVALGGVALNTG